MLTFLLTHLQPIVNSAGIILDIAGAWLVAWEVVRQYRGAKSRVTGGVLRTDYLGSDGTSVVAGQRTEETKEYVAWETLKYKRMKLGLALLTGGFTLQFVSNWV